MTCKDYTELHRSLVNPTPGDFATIAQHEASCPVHGEAGVETALGMAPGELRSGAREMIEQLLVDLLALPQVAGHS